MHESPDVPCRGDAGKVSAWFFLVPVIGVLTAWPLLGERIRGLQWAGVALAGGDLLGGIA